MSAPEVSHGRGGAGNINPDDTKYADAEIVRAGEEGTGVSTGRGGKHLLSSIHTYESQKRRRPLISFHGAIPGPGAKMRLISNALFKGRASFLISRVGLISARPRDYFIS